MSSNSDLNTFFQSAPVREAQTASSSTESVAGPSRQPHQPPADFDLQAYEGFARFLKEHTSPRSKRVTAGGRIVSAGPNSPPPTFHTEFIDRLLHDVERTKGKGPYAPPRRATQEQSSQHTFESRTSSKIGVHEDPTATRNRQSGLDNMKRHLQIPSNWEVLRVQDDGRVALIVSGGTVMRASLGPEGQTRFNVLQPSSVRQASDRSTYPKANLRLENGCEKPLPKSARIGAISCTGSPL